MVSSGSKKQQRETSILLGITDLYIKTGKPIGSNTLKDSGFGHLSSATIRNYFSKLEESGYLEQQHSSGGRIPTDLAYKYYAKQTESKDTLSKARKKAIESDLQFKDKEVIGYLNKVVNLISDSTDCAAFITSPRFDQDFITSVKLLSLEGGRALAIMLTSFGMVHTEVLYTDMKLSNFCLKRIEIYFHFRMTGLDKPELDEDELKLAEHFYNELMLRHIVGHATFIQDDLYKTGFSKLLNYFEFREAESLANGLSIFENPNLMHKLCDEVCKENHLKFWIGDDLENYVSENSECAIIMVPYHIRQKPVGAIGILGPTRIPYRKLFEILKTTSKTLSDTLNSLLFKHQISYRMPKSNALDYKNSPSHLKRTENLLLDDRSKPR
ncbi:heat-inducible transcriptional repressor HrcA [Candidatus Aerophobetes bacterium]|uniref:Heat-inducible transcription repressor HrcA n=1 Tax=Aerophobetes bacterium TaxID=2030807 RepID=A0A2A4YH08_UNCAE|nr:MAG: heat-inducible transcriptional repressor HrcA [Candidatus Aerophobetes bacterium]